MSDSDSGIKIPDWMKAHSVPTKWGEALMGKFSGDRIAESEKLLELALALTPKEGEIGTRKEDELNPEEKKLLTWYGNLADCNPEFASKIDDQVFKLMQSSTLPYIEEVELGTSKYPINKVPSRRMLYAMVVADNDHDGLCSLDALELEKEKYQEDLDLRAADKFTIVDDSGTLNKCDEPIEDGNEAKTLEDFEKRYKTTIEKMKTDIAASLHTSLQQLGSLIAGKKGSKTQRDLGSCASSGYISFNYRTVLQAWVGLTQQCDCDLNDIFGDLEMSSKRISYQTLGLGFGSRDDKEAMIRGIPIQCGMKHTFGRPLPGLNYIAVAYRGAEELHAAGYGDFVVKNLSAQSLQKMTDYLGHQPNHCSENGFVVPGNIKAESTMILQAYVASS